MLTTTLLRARILAVLGAPLLVSCGSGAQNDDPQSAAEVQISEAPHGERGPSEAEGEAPSRVSQVSHWQPVDDGSGAGCTLEREFPEEYAASDFAGCPYSLFPTSQDSLALGLREPRPPQSRPDDHLNFAADLTLEARDQGEDQACCYRRRRVITLEAVPGRPLVEDGVGRLTPSAPTSSWLVARLRRQLRNARDSGRRSAVAKAWRARAAAEHASVAAFGRVLGQLLALGAPAQLVAETQRAVRDEVLHARLCWTVAACCDDRELGAGELSCGRLNSSVSLEELAVETYLGGCLAETFAAVEAAESARRVRSAALARVLEQIAEDEGRHAALAWRTVQWALRQGGERVRRALEEVAAAPVELAGSAAHVDPDWGLLSAAERRAIQRHVQRGLIEPCTRTLLSGWHGQAPAATTPAAVPAVERRQT